MNSVFLYVQHLLGIGHLRRSVAVANSIADAGIAVYLASGGYPVANLQLHHNIEFIQLPPVRARDGDFTTLVDEQNKPIDNKWWSKRRQCLHTAWTHSRAPILLTESYPFARRAMRHELLPLLEASRQQNFCKLNVCSVRDIPQPKHNPKRVAEVGRLLTQYYDHVLVHGDKNISTLDETFPEIVSLGDATGDNSTNKSSKGDNSADGNNPSFHYTGYVDTEVTDSVPSADTCDVLVSAGGGAAGLHIYQAAIAAARIDRQLQWRLLVGHNISEPDFARLLTDKSENVVVERNRMDFRSLLKASAVSLSQAGYNTLVDVMRTDVAAVLVPYASAGEEEQTIRARKFEAYGRVVVLTEAAIDPPSLLQAIARARHLKAAKKHREVSALISGAEKSAELIGEWLDRLSGSGAR
jgi:predicted glycosyltransferase